MGYFLKDPMADLIAILFMIGTLVYAYVQWKYSYWGRRKVMYLDPTFPFGNFAAAFMQKKSIGNHFKDLYEKGYNEPFIGAFTMVRPTLIVRDPELIQTIFIKDFSHFHDRGVHCDETYDPLSGNIFMLGGTKWKNLRGKLSPTFTSGKLKAMFSTLVECGGPLSKYLEQASAVEDIIEMRELFAQYTTNIIASVAFGLEIDCIANPETPFRKFGRKIFASSLRNSMRIACLFLFPKLMTLLKLKSIDQEVEDFIISMVRQNMEHREQNNVSRKDFFQLLVQLRNTGNIEVDDVWDTSITKDENKKTLSINECAAQSFVFFAAGFETSSTTMSFALYELAKNQHCQLKLQQEIDDILKKHNGKITYESVSEMKYLDYCIDETLRKYPPVPILNRECSEKWTIPNTEIVIEKGTQIIIPVYGIHNDPKYYPEPDVFVPERFSPDITTGRTFIDLPYMPFGDGPRNCIGMRFGKMQTKVGLITMLQRHSYELAGNTIKPLVMNVASFMLAPEGGMNLKVTRRVM